MKKFIFILGMVLSGHVFAADITSGETYKISNTTASKILTVKNSSLSRGADVVIWTETNVNAQRWVITLNAGKYQLLNAYTGKILYRTGIATVGAKICQSDQNTLEPGQWDITPVDGQEGFFYITQGTGTLYLETLTTAEGSVLELQAKKMGAGSERQIWKLEQAEAKPNYLTPEVRDEMMQKWTEYYAKTPSGSCRNGTILGKGGWWGDAEMFEIVLDAFETTKKTAYETIFRNLCTNFICRNNSNWLGNNYNDDIAWMVLATVRAHLLFGDQQYLTYAKSNFDAMYIRALLPSGMLRWKEKDAAYTNHTNSCINGPAEVAACYLAIATGDDSYYTKAKNLYALQRQYLYVPSTGQVYDSFAWNGSTPSDYNYWSSTYNQGTFLGAALMLYEHFGDAQYIEDAKKIMAYTRQNLCDGNGIIRVCQTGSGDLSGFKGILMRYVRRLVVYQPEYAEWMRKNAFHAYNNRNSRGISSSAWLTKTPENFILTDCSNDCNFSNDPFGPSTAVSAAVNAPMISEPIIYANLYIVGDGCTAGWNPGSALPMTKVAEGIFTWTGQLNDNTGARRFKFLVSKQSWYPCLTCRLDVNAHLLVNSGVEYNLFERLIEQDGNPDNSFQVAVGGEYTININLNTMKMTCTKVPFVVNTAKTWAEYAASYCGDIIFEDNGQLSGIAGTQYVNGVVKIKKTFDTKKWYAIGFPFDIAEIQSNHSSYPVLTSWDGNNKGNFWIRTYNGTDDKFNDLLNVSALPAGGYAFQISNNLLNYEITFVSVPNVALSNTDVLDAKGNDYKLTVNPSVANRAISPADAELNYYILDINAQSNFGLLTETNATQKTYVAPFESVIVAKNIVPGLLRSSIYIEPATALPAPNLSKDKVIATEYYNLQGQKVIKPQPNSIYIVKSTCESGKITVLKQIVK